MAVIAIDFDHTLVEGAEPKPYAREAINLFREHGHRVLIHSCNSPEWIAKVLRDNDIRYDYIWTEEDGRKPLADIYIDDKGFRFTGDWMKDSVDVIALLVGMDNRKW